MNKKLSAEQLKAALTAEMQEQERNRQAHGTTNPAPAGEPGAFEGVGLITLSVFDVDPYEDNPRSAPNGQYEIIRESIRSRGLDQKLVVTRRPGATRYILAKGGKTRLTALQELAKENPSKFTRIDFDLVPYKSESELLVAHMVENDQREGMTFYDTAKGYLKLRDKRSKELGREITGRAFAEELKALGLPIEHNLMSEFEFLIYELATLGDIAKKLGRNNIRAQLRPQNRLIQTACEALGLYSAEDYAVAYAQWLSDYAAQATPTEGESTAAPSTADTTSSAPAEADFAGIGSLLAFIEAQAAEWMGLSGDELKRVLAALQRDRKLDAQALNAVISSTTASASSTEPGAQSPTGNTAPGGTQSHDAHHAQEGGGATDAGQAPPSSSWPLDTEDDVDPDMIDPFKNTGNYNHPDMKDKFVTDPRSLASLRLCGPDGKPLDGQPLYRGKQSSGGVPEATSTQHNLPGTTSAEAITEAMQHSIMALAQFGGIEHCMVYAPGMPYGFYVELPQQPLGADPTDYAILTWWVLANISQQFTVHEFDNVPDSGPNGFRAIQGSGGLGPSYNLRVFAQTHFALQLAENGGFMVSLLTEPDDPLAELTRSAIKAVLDYRAYFSPIWEAQENSSNTEGTP